MTLFKTIINFSLALTFGMLAMACQQQNMKKGAMTMNGKIIITENKNVKIHTYISPEDSTLVTSHIIEGKQELVLIDSQFIRPYAEEVKSYIENLHKPLRRIIVTHSHPDHWFGLELFKSIPIYSLKEVAQEIEDLGDVIIKSKKPILGDLITDNKTVPNKTIIPGTSETIDAITYNFEKIVSAEAGVQLLIRLPELNILIAQDLAFNNVHLFIGQNTFNPWIKTAEQLSQEPKNTTVLVGHGEPTNPAVFEKNIAYLNDTIAIFTNVKTGEELKKKLIEKYPDYRGVLLLDISNSFLYQ